MEAESRVAALQAQLETLRQALKNLCGIVGGSLGYAEPEMREAIGNTNIAVMELRLKEAEAALSQLPTPAQAASMPVEK
jgi:predicted negative regulator of RcsB-dependent stress response